MPTDQTFRLSVAVTLIAAAAALGYAEAAYLPEATAVAVLVVASVVVWFRGGGRRDVLSIPAANRVGFGIGAAVMVWAAAQYFAGGDRPIHTLPWPSGLLPYVGPLLLLLIPGKLFRREKHAGDYWGLQATGLFAVALGTALTDAPAFSALTGLFLAAWVWGLGLFFLARASGRVPPVPTAAPAPAPPAVTGGDGGRGAWRAAGWLGLAAAAAVPAFVLTPRSDGGRWELRRPRIEVGYAADQMVDLTNTGTLQVNQEVAFEVAAERADGHPKDDLSADTRWRGQAYVEYDGGRWRPTPLRYSLLADPVTVADLARPDAPRPIRDELPAFDDTRYYLNFAVPARLRASFVADPAWWAAGQAAPVVSLNRGGRRPWYQVADGSFLPVPLPPTQSTGERTHRYVQAVRPPDEPDLGPGFRPAAGSAFDPTGAEAVRPLLQPPPARVREWAGRVLAAAVAAGRLPAAVRDDPDPVSLRPRQQYHEAVARELRRHLASSGEYTYTLQLERQDTKVDPVEDFLFNGKAGHCERFATALVLACRGAGVPAQFVLGFRGCESVENGRYLVRQGNAHAWAEVLVSRPPPGGRPDDRLWHWLSLDPVPGEEAAADAGEDAGGGWVQWARNRAHEFYHDFVIGYSGERREKLLQAAAAWWRVLLAGAAAAAGVVVLWRLRRRRPPDPPALGPTGWFADLVAVLHPHGYEPLAGETPWEYATAAAAGLRARPATAAVAGVPLEWAEAYYDARFGGRPPTPERRASLDAGLAALRAAVGPA